MKSKGFTLIELLVVIAIIGMLSAVILASLNTARGKGADSAIKENLANLRAQAEIYYDNNGGYSSATFTFPLAASCSTASSVFVDPVFINAIAALTAVSGSAPTCILGGTTGNKASAWAMSSPLKAVSGTYWCVDSTGKSASTTAQTTGACA